jgi:hypothetical protein
LALNTDFLLAQIYLWQSSILYFELYESLLEDIHLIDIPAIILDNIPLYFLVSIIVFFALIVIFLISSRTKLVHTVSQEKVVLNNHYISNNGEDYVSPEGKSPNKDEIMGPTTGDSFGIIYYDLGKSWREN